MAECFENLPGYGERVVVDQLIDPYDPMSKEIVLIFMFADPADGNILWFMNENGSVIRIPRNPEKYYSGFGGTYIPPDDPFGMGIGMPCKSWRPFAGYK